MIEYAVRSKASRIFKISVVAETADMVLGGRKLMLFQSLRVRKMLIATSAERVHLPLVLA